MTPQLYYEAFTVGNYEEFKANPGNIRCAFNAAISASHLADHYFVYYRKNEPQRVKTYNSIGDYVEYISARTKGYFRDIRSIANAYKHLYTGNNKRYADYSSVSSAGTVETVHFSDKEIKEISEIPKTTNAAESTVVYTKKSSEQIEFMVALECVIKYWDREINN
jgi:hypothetical protein